MKTFLFDFDGTLVDSMPFYTRGVLKLLDDNGIKYEKDVVKKITPLGLSATANYFIQLGLKMAKEQIVDEIKNNLKTDYFYNIPAKDNVIDVLSELKKQGASLNVLTASPHVTLDACLKRLDMFELFDNVWSCDDFSTTKVDVKIYEMIAEKLGVKVGDIVFLDDNFNADKTAKSAGLIVCGVYDKSSEDYTQDIKNVSDYYVYDFKELLGIKF